MRRSPRTRRASLGPAALLACLLAAGAAPDPARAADPPPVHPQATLADLAHESVVAVLDGRGISSLPGQDPRTNPQPLEADLTTKRADLKARGIDLDVISVQSFTGLQDRLRVGTNVYASVPDLLDVQATGGTAVSEGIDHVSLKGATAHRQWADTCGVQPSFYGPLGINVQALYAYAGGRLRPQVQRDYVSKCFAWGRAYGSAPNTLTSLTTAPYILRVRSLNGGCATPDRLCAGYTTPYQYVPREALLAWLTPLPGEVRVLQPYDVVRGAYDDGVKAWDCTPGIGHWSSFTEGYCWDDVLWALDRLPATVEVTSLARLAAAVGRSPDRLPGAPEPPL